jgi:hypothetical protein
MGGGAIVNLQKYHNKFVTSAADGGNLKKINGFGSETVKKSKGVHTHLFQCKMNAEIV